MVKPEKILIADDGGGFPVYLHRGSGKHLVVLIHGFGADRRHTTITRMASILSGEGFSVLTFDLAGHGQRRGGNPFDLAVHVRDISAVALRFREYRHIVLVGGSFGALTGAIAASSLQSVHGLVTINGFFLHGIPNNKYRNIYLKFRLSALLPTVYRGIWKFAKQTLAPRRITAPTLVLYSAEDADMPPSESLRFYKDLNCRKLCIRIPGANHDLTRSGNTEFACKRIVEWINSAV